MMVAVDMELISPPILVYMKVVRQDEECGERIVNHQDEQASNTSSKVTYVCVSAKSRTHK